MNFYRFIFCLSFMLSIDLSATKFYLMLTQSSKCIIHVRGVSISSLSQLRLLKAICTFNELMKSS